MKEIYFVTDRDHLCVKKPQRNCHRLFLKCLPALNAPPGKTHVEIKVYFNYNPKIITVLGH